MRAVLALLGGLAVAAVVFALVTQNQVSGHCLALERISAFTESFAAPATVTDRTRLDVTVPAAHARDVHVGMQVGVPGSLAEGGVGTTAWVTATDGRTATVLPDPGPPIAIIDYVPPALLVGESGDVALDVLAFSKTQVEPTVGLMPVPGRPDLRLVLGYRGGGPPEPKALRDVHVSGPDALGSSVDPATALAVGASPEPTAGQGAVLVPDRVCRAGGIWPPVLTEDVFLPPS